MSDIDRRGGKSEEVMKNDVVYSVQSTTGKVACTKFIYHTYLDNLLGAYLLSSYC